MNRQFEIMAKQPMLLSDPTRHDITEEEAQAAIERMSNRARGPYIFENETSDQYHMKHKMPNGLAVRFTIRLRRGAWA